jgi:hypothetical protein
VGVLGSLRGLGLRVRAQDQKLFVEPRSAITEEIKSTIRINKGAILRELEIEGAKRCAAVIAARDAAGLDYWRAALVLGHLHLCGNCDSYAFGADPAGLGSCKKHGDGLLAYLPFSCRDFVASKFPTAPAFLPDPDGDLARRQEVTP